MKYKDAGVNLDAADAVVRAVGRKARSTLTDAVVEGVGPFGAVVKMPGGPSGVLLVATIDGVGTKLKLHATMGRHEDAGYDVASHCANDILCQAGRPLFFLDYIGMSRLDGCVVERIVDGMVEACLECGCALVGGETAELPDTYPEGEYEVVGCMVGVIDDTAAIDSKAVGPGDAVIGLASSGLHTNGYSLARKVLLDLRGFGLTDRLGELRCTLGDALLARHRCYVRSVLPLARKGEFKAIAHITGGGIPGNLSRVLPKGLGVSLERGSWDVPPIFKVIQREGTIEEGEMYRAFNMGLGMVLVVGRERADEVVAALKAAGEKAWTVGEVVESRERFRLT